jgi:hypothetical protein
VRHSLNSIEISVPHKHSHWTEIYLPGPGKAANNTREDKQTLTEEFACCFPLNWKNTKSSSTAMFHTKCTGNFPNNVNTCVNEGYKVYWKQLLPITSAPSPSSKAPRLLVMVQTCHHRYVHLRLIRLTWTPSPPWLPSLYMSLPLVPSPGIIVSVSCLHFLFWSLNDALPELATQRTRYTSTQVWLLR